MTYVCDICSCWYGDGHICACDMARIRQSLSNLASSLRIAASLTRSFHLGRCCGRRGWAEWDNGWQPNTYGRSHTDQGRAAPKG